MDLDDPDLYVEKLKKSFEYIKALKLITTDIVQINMSYNNSIFKIIQKLVFINIIRLISS